MKKDEAIKKLDDFYGYPCTTILVSGEWGVGKTYFIKQFLTQKLGSGSKGYVRVSAFGCNGIVDLRQKLGSEYLAQIAGGKAPAIKAILSYSKLFGDLPFLKKYAGGITNRIEDVGYMHLKSTTVWIDDLERLSTNLSIRDVLGEISTLSEERGCKVIIACNSEQLTKDPTLKADLEKAVQFSFKYDRDGEEIFSCAFEGTKENEWKTLLSETVTHLNIHNIRNLTRIKHFLEIAMRHAGKAPFAVTYQMATTVAIAVESKYGHNNAIPALAELRAWNTRFIPRETDTSIEAEKNDLLRAIGYTHTDELDNTLIDFIDTGSLNHGLLKAKVGENSKKTEAYNAEAALKAAWGIFHCHFNKSADEVIESFIDVLKAYPDAFQARRYNEIVLLMKQIGRSDAISRVLEIAPKTFLTDKASRDFNISGHNAYEYEDEISQRIILTDDTKNKENLQSILSEITHSNGWSSSDEEVLAAISEEGYRDFFTACDDGQVDEYIKRLLQFGNYSQATDRQIQISRAVIRALNLIAKDSPINQQRIEKYKRSMEGMRHTKISTE